MANLIWSKRNLVWDIAWHIDFRVAWIQLHAVLAAPVQHRDQTCLQVRDCRILHALVGKERDEVVPEHTADHCRHDGTVELLLNIL